MGFISRILALSNAEDRPAEHVRIIYSDRARDLCHIDTWGALPNLAGVASDPHNRCL